MIDLSRIRLVITDVDGVLTDGSVYVDADGRETCRYSKRDGVLLPVMREAGIRVVMMTAEPMPDGPPHSHDKRAEKLGLDLFVCHGRSKIEQLRLIVDRQNQGAESLRLDLSQVCYIGDDLPDLPCLEAVAEAGGLACVPDDSPIRGKYMTSDPCPRIWNAFTTTDDGGRGALRWVCERLLKARGYDLSVWPPKRKT